MGAYRDDINNNTYASDETADYDFQYVNMDSVRDTLDSIESRVKEILSILEPIEGLSEIDDVKDSLKKLAQDLY